MTRLNHQRRGSLVLPLTRCLSAVKSVASISLFGNPPGPFPESCFTSSGARYFVVVVPGAHVQSCAGPAHRHRPILMLAGGSCARIPQTICLDLPGWEPTPARPGEPRLKMEMPHHLRQSEANA